MPPPGYGMPPMGFRGPPGMPPPGFRPPHGGPPFGHPGAPPPLRPPPHPGARREDEERQKRAAEAWSAYKSDDGSIYYYNQVTGESSWQRPEGFTGEADKASSNPVPVKTGGGGRASMLGNAVQEGWALPPPAGAGCTPAPCSARLPSCSCASRPFLRPPAEKIAGTEWQEVTCDDGKKYWCAHAAAAGPGSAAAPCPATHRHAAV